MGFQGAAGVACTLPGPAAHRHEAWEGRHQAARTFCLAAQVNRHECVRFWGETDEYLNGKTTRFLEVVRAAATDGLKLKYT